VEIENHFLPECGRVFYFYFAGTYIFEIESPTHKHECVVHVAEYGKIFSLQVSICLGEQS